MKEEILTELRLRLEEEKRKNEEHNVKIKRIKELESYPDVREYLQLIGLDCNNQKIIMESDNKIIESIYRDYLYRIDERDTNGIYVYLGTYVYSSDVHNLDDKRTGYSSSNADYRVYFDIEQSVAKQIDISKCEQFERNHIVINPPTYFNDQEYYKIQREFFISAVKGNQDSAKKKILKKYPRLSMQSK